MQGELTPEQQLRVLTKIWGADRDGYVFLPYIDGTARTVERRRKSYHEGRAFEWPRDKPAILAHLSEHSADDVYFTPALFNAKRRTEQNVDAERTLWADLDPVDPRTLGDLRPTIAWETSPGRYQGVWLLDRPRVGASWASQENHRLTLHLGADPSGWDSTQLLRIPGRANHKPAYGDGPVPGVLLWDAGPRYQWEDFADLPEVGLVAGAEDVELLDEDLLSSVDRPKVWSTVRLKVTKRCRELMGSRTATGDRSEVLWEIERELADAGCTVLEIVALVRPTPWNKYAGRNDELRRLKTEAAKAIAARSESPLESDEEVETWSGVQWYSDLPPVKRPRWLVEDIWGRGACGFIAGQPKSYKSWVALDLAISVASGEPFLGMYPVLGARPVLYIQEEDSHVTVRARLNRILEQRAPHLLTEGQIALEARREPAGSTPRATKGSGLLSSLHPVWRPPTARMPLAVHVQTGFIASDPAWQVRLAELVAEGQFGLVIIDTLGTTAGEVDTDRSGDLMGKILKPLKTIAQENGTAICVVHHNRKSQGDKGNDRPGQAMLGSVALHAWVESALYLSAPDDGVVAVHREDKQAQGMTVRFRVPHMFENVHTGERQLWAPERVEATEEAPPEQTPKAEPKSAQGATSSRSRGAYRVKLQAVGLGRGPVPSDRVEQVLGAAVVNRLVKDGTLTFDEALSQYTWNKEK